MFLSKEQLISKVAYRPFGYFFATLKVLKIFSYPNLSFYGIYVAQVIFHVT